MTWQHTPYHPPIEEWPQTFEGLPTFMARVDESPVEVQRFLLVEFDTPPRCTAEEWKQAKGAPSLEQWSALMRTKKCLTLRVGLVGQYADWHPQDKALWTAPAFPFNKPKRSIQDGLREADRTCRNSKFPLPREALVQVLEQALQQQKKQDCLPIVVDPVSRELEETLIALGARPPDWDPLRGARHPEGLRAVSYILPPGSEGEPLGWVPIWIEPGITKLVDIMYELVLRLDQWEMIEHILEIDTFLDRHMKQFKNAYTEDERNLLRRGIALGGGEGYAEMRRTDAYPESAKGRRQYTAKTLSGLRRTAVRREAEQSGRWITMSPRSDGLCSMADAMRILVREASQDDWTPSQDWLYDQINAGRLSYALDARGWKCLDEHGLQYERKLVKDENDRRKLVAYQMDTLGKSRRAANKYIDEHTAKGESYADITTKFLPRRRREEV